ncbi:MAG: GNAT family N-acetyltransferase [Caldilineaceae bacterium]|nr:GNAT family N-acetyltransferase [Caldilineaceae bacterium]
MSATLSISIETMAAADLPALLDLLAASNLPQDGFVEYVDAAVVARIEERIVGSAALEIYGRSALLRSVAVSPAVQGQGIGRQLVEATLDLANNRGIGRIYLLTETAAGFFPRFGFRLVERDQVDEAVKQSVEFTGACPASATVMVKELV